MVSHPIASRPDRHCVRAHGSDRVAARANHPDHGAAHLSSGRYEIALVVSLITLLVLVVLTPVERAIGKRVRPERADDDE
ncbi:hypothetical protein BH23GEM5_BH23GEM5_19320 [soil metagenome]